MKLNNLYNFKNPVKNFLDIDNLKFPQDISTFDINHLVWVEPFNFRVRKQEDTFRTLKMPNILNFVAAYEYYKDMPDFSDIQNIDDAHKRLSANIDTGDFASGEYDVQLEYDFENLCIYDNLIKLDVKEYYGRIYTHKIDFQGHEERYISNMNLGATNGLLMGNYLSLYFAERNLSAISLEIKQEIDAEEIACDFSYFSDDFYFFCNRENNDKIIAIFDKVLERFELERSNKKEIWTYETFNNHNVVARYWKKLIAHCNIRYKPDRDNNKLYFINQIVYRMSKLDEDEKLKKVFINNVFKTRYFRELPLENYQVKEYDYHQLCFIMKYSPEVMLYMADRFSSMDNFDKQKVHKFFEVRYIESLKKNFNEEQLYYYYAIKIFGFEDIVAKGKEFVLTSNNQILVSYYLQEGIFETEDIEYLKTLSNEQYWFQNYHLILCCTELSSDLEESIEKYLVPQKVKLSYCDKPNKLQKRQSYIDFYKKNLEEGRYIIRNILDVKEEIIDYLNLKIAESEEFFEEEE